MNNYRVNFSSPSLDVHYWNDLKGLQAESKCNFSNLPSYYYPAINDILHKAKKLGIEQIWFFYEPDVELNWVCDSQSKSLKLIEFIKFICGHYKLTLQEKILTPKDGNFVDWFCVGDVEREFGGKRHDLCRRFVELYNEYKSPVDDGKGLKAQVGRTIHTLCNPLGLNYMDEAHICFSRGLACLLFRFLPFEVARWVYKNIFRQKY